MQAKVTTESGALNLRAGKSTATASLLKIPKGGMVTVLDSSDAEWWRVSYGSSTGYVMANFLTVVGSETGDSGGDGLSVVIACASATEAARVLA